MPEEEKTVVAGAEPADKGATVGLPTDEKKDAKADSSPDVVVDKDGKPLPWSEQPKWKSARAAEKKLNDLLKANDLDDPDDLLDLVQRGKTVKGKLADLNQLDTLIEKSNKLDKYEAYWRDQEEKKRRETEDPDQTIARLEHALRNKSVAEQNREAQRQQSENAKQAIQSYEREVSGLVKDLEVPKDQQSFVLEFFGVGNPANDVDITDRKAIKKLISDGIKKKESYDQAVIAAYLKGKEGIPKIGSAAGATATETKPKIYLKDARKIFLETMQRGASGG